MVVCKRAGEGVVDKTFVSLRRGMGCWKRLWCLIDSFCVVSLSMQFVYYGLISYLSVSDFVFTR